MKSHFLFCIVALLAAAASPLSAGVLQGESSQPTGRFGSAVSELEDLDGDGFWEILVGAPEHDATGTNDGKVYLWLGGPTMAASAWHTFPGDNNEQFGFAVARVGDVNGDGQPDFAVGAPRYSLTGADRGRVYVFFGSADPPTSWEPAAVLECPSATSGPQFGFAVAAAGDFNGDGIDDLIVGAPFDDTIALDAGSSWIFYGDSSVAQLQTPDLQLSGALAYDHFGWSVSDVPDFFNDGNAAVVVGAPANGGVSTDAGLAYVFRGTSSPSPGPDAVADVVLQSAAAGAADNWFGYCARGLGDWDGDGDGDIAVGIPQDDVNGLHAGRVEVFFGGTTPDGVADRYAGGADGGDLFGWSIADAGDATGDARADVLIGAPGVAVEGTGAGRAYLFAGGSSDANTPDALDRTFLPGGTEVGTAAGDAYGVCVSAAGLLDADALVDLAVGAPTGNVATGAVSGYVRLHGSAGEIVPALLQSWEAFWTRDGAVRLVFALAEPQAGFAWLALWRETLSADGETMDRSLSCEGAPGAGTLPLATVGTAWTLTDHPALLPAGASLAYALVLTSQEGKTVELAGLAGPRSLEPVAIELLPPSPNPFNPITSIVFRAAAGEHVACRVYDLRGRRVATLQEGVGTGLWQRVVWDGHDARGRTLPAGAYAIRAESQGRVAGAIVMLAK